MLVLPLFWDQHDNAQRVQESHLGVHLPTYHFSELEFYTALDMLLSDTSMHERMGVIAARLQAEPGTHKAADLVWRLAQEKRPVTE
jgi:UDP:flavonoid glycosyltransferase YjiC (YdhE family)